MYKLSSTPLRVRPKQKTVRAMGLDSVCVRVFAAVAPLVLLTSLGSAVPLGEFYPFGFNRSISLPRSNDVSSEEISLRVPINFFDRQYTSIFINENGVLSFSTSLPEFLNMEFPLGFPLIAPFYANIDTTGTGTIFYHESEDRNDLLLAAQRVRRSFASAVFQPTAVFVVTWDRVGYHSRGIDKVNTFQVAISSDGQQSYVEFLYADSGIQWIRGTPRPQGLADALAQVGFESETREVFSVKGSGSDRIINVARKSNVREPGMYLYRTGPTNNGQIVLPDLADAEQGVDSCDLDDTLCHSKAACITKVDGSACCSCQGDFFGNGRSCIPKGIPFRANGKLSGMINEVNVSGVDLQAYIMPNDGRAYTALSGVPTSIGPDLQLLSPIAMSISWLFAKPASAGAPNGFMLTGGVATHSIDQFFPQYGDRISVTIHYRGLDVYDQLRVDAEISGSVPSQAPNSSLRMDDHEELFVRDKQGLFTSTSRQAFTVGGSDLETRFQVEQRLEYNECGRPEWSEDHSNTLKVTGALNLISYEAKDGIVRLAATSKITTKLNETDPCIEGRRQCGPNSICIPTSDSFECQCNRGFEKLNTRYAVENGIEECVDIDECQIGTASCSQNAKCDNTPGGFQCRCYPGFLGDGYTCEPQRSCHELRCHENATCPENRCQCLPGFEGDGYYCQSYDDYYRPSTQPPRPPPTSAAVPVAKPCAGPEDCSELGACNLDEASGSHVCVCLHGFVGDGVHCQDTGELSPKCEDGECTCARGYMYASELNICLPDSVSCDSLNNCDPHANCIYVPGISSFRCVCHANFIGDGYDCISNVASCLELQDCHEYAECAYLIDEERHECQCLPGYFGDGRESCARPTSTPRPREPEADCRVLHDCHPDARCGEYGGRYQCVCNPGFEGDGRRACHRALPPGCDILNDCGRNARCVSASYDSPWECKCNPGFYGDGYHCERDRNAQPHLPPPDTALCGSRRDHPCEEKPTDFMVIAYGMALMKLPLLPPKKASDLGHPVQFHHFQQAVGITVDCADKIMYWTDVASKSIKTAFYNGTNVMTFLEADIQSPEGIAVDWVSRNVYWADSAKDTIEVASLDTRRRTTVVQNYLVNPRGIAVHPRLGKLFWSDWDRVSPKIEWSNADGSERENFVPPGTVKLPNSLAIDFDRDELCWADAGTKTIECMGIMTRARRTVSFNCSYPFGLAMSPDNYYWTDWMSQKVESASRPEGIIRTAKDVPLGGSGKMYGLVIVPESCPRMSNVCGWNRGYCSPDRLCLPTPNGRRCVCPLNQPCTDE